MKKLLCVGLLGAFLAGCGGEGSGVGSAYVGVTTQATVTSENAIVLSADAYAGTRVSSSASGVAKQALGNGAGVPMLHDLSQTLQECISASVADKNPAEKTVAANTVGPRFGYSGSFTVSYEQTSEDYRGTVTFSQYRKTDTSPTLSGSINFSTRDSIIFTRGIVGGRDSGSVTPTAISFDNLTGTIGTDSFTMSGTMSFTSYDNTVTMNIVMRDDALNRTFWMKDLVLTLTGNQLSISGSYYDPVHGFVVISTIAPLIVAAIDAVPTSGRLHFTGSNQTKASLTFTSGGHSVSVDTAGNGTFASVP